MELGQALDAREKTQGAGVRGPVNGTRRGSATAVLGLGVLVGLRAELPHHSITLGHSVKTNTAFLAHLTDQ